MTTDQLNTIKKFVKLLDQNIQKVKPLQSFHSSMQILQFLADIGLDHTSAGYLAEDMHLSRSQQKQIATSKQKRNNQIDREKFFFLQQNYNNKPFVKKVQKNIISDLDLVIHSQLTDKPPSDLPEVVTLKPGLKTFSEQPMDIVTNIMAKSNSFELLSMTISSITTNFNLLTSITPSFHSDFLLKLSDRLHCCDSATSLNKLERHLRPFLEEYLIGNYLAKSCYETNTQATNLSLLPIISKFGGERMCD